MALLLTLSFLETEKLNKNGERGRKKGEPRRSKDRVETENEERESGKRRESETVEKEERGQGSAPSDIWLSPS